MKRDFIKTDAVIVGSGVAGLFAALCLPESKKVLVITKEDLKECDSYLAQGGVCVLKDIKDFDCYFEDTMRAGHYENNPESVRVMIESSPDARRMGRRLSRKSWACSLTRTAAVLMITRAKARTGATGFCTTRMRPGKRSPPHCFPLQKSGKILPL